MVTTRHATNEDRPQKTAQTNDYDLPTSSDGDIPAEPIPNYKRSRSLFFGTKTLRPIKRVRNSIEYIPPSRRRKTPESIVGADDQDQSDKAGGREKDGDIDEDEDALLSKQLAFEAMNSFLQPRDPSATSTDPHPEPQSSETGVKRRRGRPRKHPLPAIAEQTSLSRRALDEIEALAKETLGPVDDHDRRIDRGLDSVEVKTRTSEPVERQGSPPPSHANDYVRQPSITSVKRGRGRPRKTPLPVTTKDTLETVNAHNQQRVLESVEIEDQLPRDADDNLGHEVQQEKEAVHEKEAGATQLAQELDSEWDEEFPPIRGLKKPKRATQQSIPSAQPELGPRPIPQQPAQESDSESDEEFPSLEKLIKAKRTEKQSILSTRPESSPKHTSLSQVLGGDPSDELAHGDEYQNQEDEETVWTEEDEEHDKDDQPTRAQPAVPLLFEAPKVLDEPYEVEIKGSTISWLRALMGSLEWTGLKEDDTWARTIIEPYRNGTRTNAATNEIRDFCGQLYGLKVLFDQAPRTRAATHFEQNKYLRSVHRYLTEDMTQIRQRFAEVEQHLVSNGAGHPKYRHQLRQDLFDYGIPMLVLVLSSAYCLGRRGEGDDADRDYESSRFPSSGMFTTTRIQYLVRVTGWLKRLGTKLSEVPNDASSVQEGDSSRRLNIKVLKGEFAEILTYWEETLQKALGELEHIRKRQAEKRARDEAIKKAKEDAKKAYLDQMHARDEAIMRARREAEEKERAKKDAFLEGLFPPTTPQHRGASSSRPSPRVGQGGQKATTGPSLGMPPPRSTGAEVTSSAVHWSREENQWLLKQLRLTGPRVSDTQYEEWAVALQKPTVAEVRNQAEKMRAAAREVAYECDTVLELWARLDVDY